MTDTTTFYDEDVGDAVNRWTPDNASEGIEFKLVKRDGQMYKGFIVEEVKSGKKTGDMIKVRYFFLQIGKEVKECKFGPQSMEKWIAKHGKEVIKWANKVGVITHGKVNERKYIIAIPKGTLD